MNDPTSAELARFRILALMLAGKARAASVLADELRDTEFSAWLAAVGDDVDG